MKRTLLLLSVLGILATAPANADSSSTLIVNGEAVSKVVTSLTFDGDNVVIHFGDDTTVSDMSAVRLSFDMALSVQDISAFEMRQPVDGQLSVSGLADDAVIHVYNASGREVIAGTKSSSINVSSLPAGIYVLKSGSTVVKFLKK